MLNSGSFPPPTCELAGDAGTIEYNTIPASTTIRVPFEGLPFEARNPPGARMSSKPSRKLPSFKNPSPHRDFLIRMQIPEFTCLCPMTGQPDFATLFLDYVPDRKCLELKGLKLYIWSFRNEGAFHEAVTNAILDDIVKAIAPRFARLTARFFVRGGIFTTVVAEHRKTGWKSVPLIELPLEEPNSSTSA